MEARPLGWPPSKIFSHFSVAQGQEEATDSVLVSFTGNFVSLGNDPGASSYETTSCFKLLLCSEVWGSLVALLRERGKYVRGILTAQSVWHTC